MTDHPYKGLPARAFWSSGVSGGLAGPDLVEGSEPLLRPNDRIMSAGSCFAANMVPWLEDAGYAYVRTEEPPPAIAALPENLAYRRYSAAYGNVYTARQFRQLLERAEGTYWPSEDRWHERGVVVDPFRPGLAYPASSDQEFDDLIASHLAAVRRAIEQATVLVFTLGLTETWAARDDGAVYPTCPGTVGGTYEPDKYAFVQLTVDEVVTDMKAALAIARTRNPSLRVLLTVSPVPLAATAAGGHVLLATIYSKSVLRVAAQIVADTVEGVRYFPAYEIITGPQAPPDFFEEDRRSVSQAGVQTVMGVFLASCELPDAPPERVEKGDRPLDKTMRKAERKSRRQGMGDLSKPARKAKQKAAPDTLAASEAVSKAMCDEELLATWAPSD